MTAFSDTGENPDALLMAPRPTRRIDGGTLANREGVADALTWEVTAYDDYNWVLTVSGTGGIPDYGRTYLGEDRESRPWHAYEQDDRIRKIVLGDGINYVGKCAFLSFYEESIDFGNGALILDAYSFFGNTNLCAGGTLVIPGNVKKLIGRVFGAPVKHVVLEEGVEVLDDGPLVNCGQVDTLHIPASVHSINSSDGTSETAHIFNGSSYTVAQDSPYFKAVDGILYSKDGTVLVDYPPNRVCTEFRVPEHVRLIQKNVFREVYSINKLYIPSTVEEIESGIYTLGYCGYDEVYIEDGVKIDSYVLFYQARNLKKVRLPNDVPMGLNGTYWPATVESLNIPSHAGIHGTVCPSTQLSDVYYNAMDSSYGLNNNAGNHFKDCRFKLTIGPRVDVLPWGFYEFPMKADSILFEGPNHINITTVEGKTGPFAHAPAPLTDLIGTVYIDEQGILYRYDVTSATAELLYVSPGVTNVVIPAAIPAEDGTVCTVTSVGKNCLKEAQGLQSITFEDPSVITQLSAHGLANCPTLTSVNGETTVEGATATFTAESLIMGYAPFYNTGLTGAAGPGSFAADMDGQSALRVSREGFADLNIFLQSKTLTWESGKSGGGYRILTGDTLSINAAMGNTSGNTDHVYRVYFRIGEDSNLNVIPGKSYTFENGLTAVCCATEDPYTVYLEFTLPEGDTSTVYATEVYPSPSSPGGQITVWGCLLTREEAALAQNALLQPAEGQTIQAYWTTRPDSFGLEKTASGAEPQLVGDGAGGAIPDRDISWSVEFSRENTETDAFGKDLVKSVDYSDIFTFPAGMDWAPAVVAAARSGDSARSGNIIYAGGVKAVSLTSSNSTVSNARLVWDETLQTLVVRWTVRNPSRTSEIGAASFNLTLHPQAVRIDMSVYDSTAANNIKNTAAARVHYHYSTDAVLESTAVRSIGSGNGKLELVKVSDRVGVAYFGEDVTYTVSLSNVGGLPYVGNEGVYTLTDSLDNDICITPENMQRMFAEHPDLSVVIYPATLESWNRVTGVDGTEAWQHPGNSPSKNEHNHLTITWDGAFYTVKVQHGNIHTATTVAEALQKAGYAVTDHCTYNCSWPLNDAQERFTVNGGQPIVRMVYGTFKNSFQNLVEDCPNQYPSDHLVWMSNSASVRDSNGDKLVSCNVGNNVRREAVIAKTAFLDGMTVHDLSAAEDEDVLEYRVDFTHYGTGEYRNLPIVDDIIGSQYLLVPKAANTALAGQPEHGEYYCLTPGTYRKVTVGVDDEGRNLIADSVIVTEAADSSLTVGDERITFSGLHTTIKWYFPELPGKEYMISITYQTLVDLSLGDLAYTVANTAWINGRPGSRIYSTSYGTGSIIQFEKCIVTTLGDTPGEDSLAKESLVGPGEQVTYRIELSNSPDDPTTIIRGKRIMDILPNTFETFQWQKGVNVSDLRVVGTEGVVCEGIDDWYISDSAGGLLGNHSRYMLWPETTTITIPSGGAVYLYVTLTYPDDDAAGVWDLFARQAGGSPLRNTFSFHQLASVVTHELKEPGNVLLQKGVLGMYYLDGQNRFRPAGNSRYFYNNRDSRSRFIAYYVMLSNQGNKRMYLSDLVDILPDGFSFYTLRNNGKVEDSYHGQAFQTVTLGGIEPFGDNPPFETPASLLYRKASITATETPDGVTFSISNGDKGDLPYDEERKLYYLDRNEAISFVYICNIGLTAETENDACNTIGMAYYDHLDTGAVIVGKDVLPVTAPTFAVFSDSNDGKRLLTDGEIFGDPGSQWLASDVTVHRGKILPGITKRFTGYTDLAADTYVDAPPSVDPSPKNLIHWSICLHNSGTLSITDYTITDIMPAPYTFQGDLEMVIYDREGADRREMQRRQLLTFPERSGGEQVLIAAKAGGSKINIDMTTGAPVTLDDSLGLSISMTRDAKGNEVLVLHCQGAGLAIPEGGYVELILSSRNPTTRYQNAVYTNRATLVPNVQPFTKVGQGSMITDGDTPVGVENWAPLTVGYGYSTSSEKRVAEKENTANTAGSKGEQVIWLTNADGIFTYTLCVSNDTPIAMTQLVLIDNLPQVGDASPFKSDAPRGSEFSVNLAQEPNFRVVVTPEDGQPYDLDSRYYTIFYSADTQFGGPQSADWKGETSGTTAQWTAKAQWTNNLSEARAIRLVIQDDSGTMIPAGAKVSLSFDAQKAGTALPGQKAWNSFGYHYTLKDVTQELEAMPLPVAVAIPNNVYLVKELVDPDGNPAKAQGDMTFRFVITRESNGESCTVPVTVVAGESTSEKVSLADLWTWTAGERYSIQESSLPDGYSFDSFVDRTGDSFVFTYNPADTQEIRCVNQKNSWSIVLTKTGEDGRVLGGALFGLYSTDQTDQIELPEEYADLQIPATMWVEGTAWYLAEIAETNADGTLSWENLLLDRYWLQELRAPAGYQIKEAGQLLERTDGSPLLVTVVNSQYYELPQCGGSGREVFLFLGILLTGGTTLCQMKRRKR